MGSNQDVRRGTSHAEYVVAVMSQLYASALITVPSPRLRGEGSVDCSANTVG